MRAFFLLSEMNLTALALSVSSLQYTGSSGDVSALELSDLNRLGADFASGLKQS